MTRDAFFTGDKPPQWHFEGEDDEDDLLSKKEEPIEYREEKSFNETLDEMAEMAMSIGIMERWTCVYLLLLHHTVSSYTFICTNKLLLFPTDQICVL